MLWAGWESSAPNIRGMRQLPKPRRAVKEVDHEAWRALAVRNAGRVTYPDWNPDRKQPSWKPREQLQPRSYYTWLNFAKRQQEERDRETRNGSRIAYGETEA
jgi:hypothetical protein